jgi:esterase/lipase
MEPDTTQPQVTITNPSNGTTVSDTVTIEASVTDDIAVKSVSFYIDGDLLSVVPDEPYGIRWNTRESTNGDHNLRCKATDTSDNESMSDSIHVTVSNEVQITEEEINFRNQYGVDLGGRRIIKKGAEIAVVMAHSGVSGESQIGLHSTARDLAGLGFTVLTFDFPGYGRTGGSPSYGLVDRDVRAAISFLENQGFTQIVCLGVGLGGIACGKSGLVPSLVGLVLISCPTDVCCPTLSIQPSDLTRSYPKLIIAAEDDFANGRPFAQYAQTIYDYSTDPKEIKIFTGPYHSMELFRLEHAEEMNDLLLEFFQGLL